MRLLNTSTLLLEQFSNHRKRPRYAILSHTWEDGQEVLFADIGTEAAKAKTSYQKLEHSCREAKNDRLNYIWIDTCCIDKSSSAELSEAINSMYSWYDQAIKCYVYLSDFPSRVASFTKSRWFKRGWTLQELIAPKDVVFYSSQWEVLGNKLTLSKDIGTKTKIDVDILSGKRDLMSASVARRMSWASDRKTTRVEDEAYCLMGLFNVNMPLLYGEGRKAFIRLQEEIMRNSDDQTLFAWRNPSVYSESRLGLLTDSPKWFKSSSEMVPYYPRSQGSKDQSFSVGNKGIRLDLWLRQTSYLDDRIAVLDCSGPNNLDSFAGIYLRKFSGSDQFARIRANIIEEVDTRVYGPTETIHVLKSPRVFVDQFKMVSLRTCQWVLSKYEETCGYEATTYRGYLLKTTNTKLSGSLLLAHEPGGFIPASLIFKISNAPARLAGAILFEKDGEDSNIALLIGSDSPEGVDVDIIKTTNLSDWKDLEERFKERATLRSEKWKKLFSGDHQIVITLSGICQVTITLAWLEQQRGVSTAEIRMKIQSMEEISEV